MNDGVTEALETKLMILNDRLWEQRLPKPAISAWLRNFSGRVAAPEVERLHALFWLSQFMYFGSREIRVLIRSMFRDLYLRPLIEEIRLTAGISDEAALEVAVQEELEHTRFFGVGNPSESGVHLLYYFRQENQLSKDNFMDAVRIFQRSSGTSGKVLRNPEIRRYVFLDDVCGSGDTAIDYSEDLLSDIRAVSPSAKFSYLCLFATKDGLSKARSQSLFGKSCDAVYELDGSYRCISPESRFFSPLHDGIDKDIACRLIKEYGDLLNPNYATGWKDSQMLMGFHHNTPDNTVGIIWYDSNWGSSIPWSPAFKRYPKV